MTATAAAPAAASDKLDAGVLRIAGVTVIGAIIGIPMIIVGSLASIVLGIVGAIKSWNGEAYTYPWQVKVLS